MTDASADSSRLHGSGWGFTRVSWAVAALRAGGGSYSAMGKKVPTLGRVMARTSSRRSRARMIQARRVKVGSNCATLWPVREVVALATGGWTG